MIKKITFFMLFLSLLCLTALFSQQEKVTVIVKMASIYSESSENSYEIDRAELGDVLTLFEPWKGEKEWLYVIFRSERWKGEVTGFIKSSFVLRGEVVPEELIAKTTAEAEEKEMEAEEEGKEETNELPSLKEVFKPENTKPHMEEKASEPDEMKIEEAEVRAKGEEEIKAEEATEPEPVESETGEIKQGAAKETAKLEKVRPEIREEIKNPEHPQPESDKEPEIEEEPKPIEIKIDTFLGETEILEKRLVQSPEIVARESNAYEVEQVLPPPIKAGEAEATLGAEEEYKREDMSIPPVEEAPKTEIKVESEPEIIPIKTEVMLTESEMLPFRTVVAPLPMAGEARAYAVISIREEVPTLEIRQEEVKDVAEADQEQIKIEPYEIETKEPELPAIPVKAENEGIKEKETIPVEVKAEEMAQEIPPVQQRKPPPELIKPELPSAQRIGNLTIGFGYGPSYGGMGASLQLNTKSGLSLHAGAGYYPSTYYYSDFDWLKNRILFSAGIKYYLPFKSEKIHPYLDLQYGGLTVEAVQIPSAIYEGEVLYENLQKNLYGVSFLGGLELKFGRAGARGALGISYNTTEWEYWDRNIFLNGEFALVVYF